MESQYNRRDHDGGYIISPSVPVTTSMADYLRGIGDRHPLNNGVFVRKVSNALTPEMYGASDRIGGMGVSDAINMCAIACKKLGMPLILMDDYVVSNSLDLRDIAVVSLGNIELAVERGTVMLGSSVDTHQSPEQYLNSISRQLRLVSAAKWPEATITGSYNQQLTIYACPYIQIQSIDNIQVKGNTFTLRDVGFLELVCKDGNPHTVIQHNIFNLRIVNRVIIQGSSGGISHNTFNDPIFISNNNSIEVKSGSHNKFNNAQFAPTKMNIVFGKGALGNIVIANYDGNSSVYSVRSAKLTDEGEENLVYCLNKLAYDSGVVASVTLDDILCDSAVGPLRNIKPCINRITAAYSGNHELLTTDYIPYTVEDIFTFTCSGNSDAECKYLFNIQFYNKDHVRITPSAKFVKSNLVIHVGKTRVNSVNPEALGELMLTNKGIKSGVRYVKLGISSSHIEGMAESLTITHHSKKSVSPLREAPPPLVLSSPKEGFVKQGTSLDHISYGRRYLVTYHHATNARQVVIKGRSVIPLQDVAHVAKGDVIGISVDNGSTHWSEVVEVTTDSVKIADKLRYGIPMDSRVVFTRWSMR